LGVGLGDAVACADVFEGQFSSVSEHAVVMAVGDPEIERAAALNVRNDRTHG
jgi:hypothetical protein